MAKCTNLSGLIPKSKAALQNKLDRTYKHPLSFSKPHAQLPVLTSPGINTPDFKSAFSDQFYKKGSVLCKTALSFLKLGDPSFLNSLYDIQSKYCLWIISFINILNWLYFYFSESNDWEAGDDGIGDCISNILRKIANVLDRERRKRLPRAGNLQRQGGERGVNKRLCR